jgi:hypothetical protein
MPCVLPPVKLCYGYKLLNPFLQHINVIKEQNMTAQFRLKTPYYELKYKPLPKYWWWHMDTHICCNKILCFVCGSKQFICFFRLRSQRFINILPFNLRTISLANLRIQLFLPFPVLKWASWNAWSNFDCFLSCVYHTSLGDLSVYQKRIWKDIQCWKH